MNDGSNKPRKARLQRLNSVTGNASEIPKDIVQDKGLEPGQAIIDGDGKLGSVVGMPPILDIVAKAIKDLANREAIGIDLDEETKHRFVMHVFMVLSAFDRKKPFAAEFVAALRFITMQLDAAEKAAPQRGFRQEGRN